MFLPLSLLPLASQSIVNKKYSKCDPMCTYSISQYNIYRSVFACFFPSSCPSFFQQFHFHFSNGISRRRRRFNKERPSSPPPPFCRYGTTLIIYTVLLLFLLLRCQVGGDQPSYLWSTVCVQFLLAVIIASHLSLLYSTLLYSVCISCVQFQIDFSYVGYTGESARALIYFLEKKNLCPSSGVPCGAVCFRNPCVTLYTVLCVLCEL